MNLLSLRRAGAFMAFATLLTTSLVGCPEKKAAVVEEAAAPPPPPPSAPTVTELAPLIDDAGADADAAEAEAPKRRPGPAMTANQAKIKACCNAMRAQAKQLASSPEGYQLNSMAAQCDVFVTQLGPQGSAPELTQFREILKTIKLPSACQF
ncbi:MAG TPA: hypothetical protein VEK07_21380 [Polyangiaceae bacterium]|nr:hypothetical protein [Polyangiaceae bacterium]